MMTMIMIVLHHYVSWREVRGMFKGTIIFVGIKSDENERKGDHTFPDVTRVVIVLHVLMMMYHRNYLFSSLHLTS